MHKHRELTETRITLTIERIRALIYEIASPVEIEAFHVGGESIPYVEAIGRTFVPFAIRERWGRAWDTTWFRVRGTVPAECAGREVVARIELGSRGPEGFTCEGLVWRDGVPVIAINVHRSDVPIVKQAAGGESFEFWIEAAANPNSDIQPDISDRSSATPLFQLGRAELAHVNRDALAYFHDFRVAAEAMLAMPKSTPRRGQLLYALNESVNLFDPAHRSTIAAARAALTEVLAKKNGDTAHRISAIGHAHIDTAWLWPVRETIRKCARTFATALAYMEEHPDYVFACSQAQQYAWMKEFYPTIYDGIKKAVARGQWEPIGSMWVEPDCNITSGESLVRQLLHGRNFFLEEFGIETTDVWLPDVFGCCGSLPQIMKKSGVKYFTSQKISWNQFNQFPHHTFWWEGIDGSRVFAHFLPAETYNAAFTPEELAFQAANFKEHDRATRSLYAFGYGDGGGGPTREMLETAARVADFEGLPRVTIEKLSEFFAKAETDARDLPVWVGELYLELHRGTYTTQARTKLGNRQSEGLLREAEFFSAVAGDLPVRRVDAPRALYDIEKKDEHTAAAYLDRAWKLTLLNQFHDILPGSSARLVYEDSERDYATIRALAHAVIEPARESLVAGINTAGHERPAVVFNTTSFTRTEVASLPDGSPIHVEVPPCGYTVIDLNDRPPVASFAAPVEVFDRKRLLALDNGMVRIVFDRDGLIRSIRDHRLRREVIASGVRGNVFQLHRDLPNRWDAWDVDIFYKETVEEVTALESMEVVETDDLRATVRIVRKFGKSKITQRISLCAASTRIDFATEVDWQEEHRFLKVAFPVNVRSPRATYEIPYGHLERPTHFNTSWDMARFEVCAQRWADLSEGDYGVALLNDCKYGYDIHGNVMRLSLLRAPTKPDLTADRGTHRFTYSLVPHLGDFRQARVIQHAYALNVPLTILPTDAHAGTQPAEQSLFLVDRAGVLIETVKNAEREEALIVRIYESYGTRGVVTLKTALPVTAAFTADLIEQTLKPLELKNGAVTLTVAPFEIVTLKFVKG